MGSYDLEILVHITAPSRAVDDAHFRALASAYLDFEPAKTTPVPPLSESPRLEKSSSDQPIDSPDLSFKDAEGNAASPSITRWTDAEALSPHREELSQISWLPPPSVVTDSMPENDVSIAAYSSPTRVLEYYLQERDESPGLSQPPQQRQQTATPGPVDLCATTPGLQSSVPHVIQCTPPGDGPLKLRLRPQLPLSSRSEDRVSSSFRAESEPPPIMRQKLQLGLGVASLARSSSDTCPEKSRTIDADAMGGTRKRKRDSDPLEIRPPESLVSSADLDPSALVTEPLAKLARDVNIAKRFRPQQQQRDLRPFERGYWLLDCSGWDENLKEEAWTFLTNYVGNGRAGWGIWCRRDEGQTYIRLYCWGQVVGHMFLLLYLASRRRVLYTGCSWIGADGRALVVMGAKET